MEEPSVKEKFTESDSFLSLMFIISHLCFAWGIKIVFSLTFYQTYGVFLSSLFLGIIVNGYRRYF